ncbi:MAG: GNAT family N-acetyltransferase, partial [Leucothrix sp.]
IRQSTEVEIAEFYIKPAARQRGIGRLAVEALIQRHVGVWLVSVFPGNARALVFWKTVLNDLDLSNLTESEAAGSAVFRFEGLNDSDD